MNSESLIRILIREMKQSSESLPEYGSQQHLEELDKILNDIQNLKQTLKKGPDRHKNRKEVNQLQSAVQALRFLRRRAHKSGIKTGLIKEGGLKAPHLTGHVTLDSDTVSAAIDVYKTVIDMWNKYLELNDMKPVVPIGPVGSSAYYLKDKPGTEYGDVDFLVSFPVEIDETMGPADIRKSENAAKKNYENLLRDFLNTSVDVEEYINTAATNRGSPFLLIVRLPNGDHVQVDTIVTYPQYSPEVGEEKSQWMPGRWIPEQGFKGYTIGNLYMALGNHFNMSIGDRGVSARVVGDQRVSPRKTSADLVMISKNIRTFLRDIAHEVAGEDVLEDELLIRHPGVNPSNIKISDLASGIKGLALTLSNSGDIDSSDAMLDSVIENYKAGLQRNVESKLSKGLDKESYNKLLNLNDKVLGIVKSVFEA